MQFKKNIKIGKIKFYFFLIIFIACQFFSLETKSQNNLEGKNTDIKILDKISSKNELLKLINGKETKHKDLLIKSMKCKNSEFDDNPEITAYIQVKDLTNKKKDDVFVFN